MRYYFVFIITMLMMAGCAHAQVFSCTDSSTDLTANGGVSITAIPGGTITFNPGGTPSSSAATTLLNWDGIPAGTYPFTITYTGYNNYSGQVQVCHGTLTIVKVPLSSTTTTTTSTLSLKTGLQVTIQQVPAVTTVVTTAPATTATATPATTTASVTAAVTAATTAQVETATATETIASRTQIPTTALTPVSSGSTGSVNISTTPSGAAIYIDGVQRGISPATIPGLAPGDHTLLLKLDGYSDLTVPVTITAGETQPFTTSLSPATQGQAAANASATKKSQGFAGAIALVALAGAALIVRKIR